MSEFLVGFGGENQFVPEAAKGQMKASKTGEEINKAQD